MIGSHSRHPPTDCWPLEQTPTWHPAQRIKRLPKSLHKEHHYGGSAMHVERFEVCTLEYASGSIEGVMNGGSKLFSFPSYVLDLKHLFYDLLRPLKKGTLCIRHTHIATWSVLEGFIMIRSTTHTSSTKSLIQNDCDPINPRLLKPWVPLCIFTTIRTLDRHNRAFGIVIEDCLW